MQCKICNGDIIEKIEELKNEKFVVKIRIKICKECGALYGVELVDFGYILNK